MPRAMRKRSTSEGEGDRLSSTLNLPKPCQSTGLMNLMLNVVFPLLRLIPRGLLMITLRITRVIVWNLESGPEPEAGLVPSIEN